MSDHYDELAFAYHDLQEKWDKVRAIVAKLDPDQDNSFWENKEIKQLKELAK